MLQLLPPLVLLQLLFSKACGLGCRSDSEQ